MARKFNGGFTLLELLAVMALIIVLAGSLGLVTIRLGGRSIDAAERLAGAQFHAARNLALLKRTRVRVIVNGDSSDPDRYLREMGLLYDAADPDNSPQWVAQAEGRRLPPGFYFRPALSSVVGGQDMLEIPVNRPQPEGNGSLYYYFEYDQSGRISSSGGQFIIEAGKLESEGAMITVVPSRMETGEQRLGGLLLLRLGGILYLSESVQ